MFRKILLSATVISLAASTMVMAQEVKNQDAATVTQQDKSRVSRHFQRLDANKDGTISVEELSAQRMKSLKAADTDGDGVLSAEEIANFIQKRDMERRVRKLTRALDIDGDGKVTIAEIETHQAKRFALMDRNNDGQLSGDELRKSASRKMKSSRGEYRGHDRFHQKGEKHSHWHGKNGSHHAEKMRAAKLEKSEKAETPAQ